MLYTEEYIQIRADAIKIHYGFEQVIFKRETNGILFFDALEKGGSVEYVKLNPDGKLFGHTNGRWSQAVGFLFRDEKPNNEI